MDATQSVKIGDTVYQCPSCDTILLSDDYKGTDQENCYKCGIPLHAFVNRIVTSVKPISTTE